METGLTALAIAVMGAMTGITTTIIASWLNRRKTQAEAGQALAEGADEIVTSALAMVKELKVDLNALKKRVKELEVENGKLKALVAEQGLVIANLELELCAKRGLVSKGEQDAEVDG